MAVKIKLKRMGKIRAPFYRIIVADARTKRDGRAIEEIGKYHPKVDPSLIEVDSERAQYWLSVGAQPTDPVRKLLEVTGDWQKFKGLPGAEGTLKTAAPAPDKKEAFAAAVAETVKDLKVKGGGKADGKAAEAKTDSRGKARKPAASADKPKAAKDDAAAKNDAAKDSAAKDSAAKADAKTDAKDSAAKADAKADAKDSAAKADAKTDAKDSAAKADAKDGTAKESAAKETGGKTGAAKGAPAKGATAKSDAEGSASEEAAPAKSEPAAATASDAGQDGEA